MTRETLVLLAILLAIYASCSDSALTCWGERMSDDEYCCNKTRFPKVQGGRNYSCCNNTHYDSDICTCNDSKLSTLDQTNKGSNKLTCIYHNDTHKLSTPKPSKKKTNTKRHPQENSSKNRNRSCLTYLINSIKKGVGKLKIVLNIK